ncbi:MAG: site-specific DNA-methyltransferase [Pyrinomonadaceae bacterium]
MLKTTNKKTASRRTARGDSRPSPFFVDDEAAIRLYRGDALDLLRRARGGVVDLVFADPPYFLSNDGVTCQSGRMVSVNKGRWDRLSDAREMHEFNLAWLAECRRLLKPTGTIWVSGTSHNIHSVGYALQTLGFKILNDVAWLKTNPPPNLSCRYFTHATETLIWARRDETAKHKFNYAEMKRANAGKQMQSLWRIGAPSAREKRYGKHPTQKPEALIERILLASTDAGDLVVDPFCGSGTTAVACARLGRHFAGFELDANYLKVAAKRIKDELRSPRTR